MNTSRELTPEDLFSKLTAALPEGTEIVLRAEVGKSYVIEIRLDTLNPAILRQEGLLKLNGVLGEAGASPTFWGNAEQADWRLTIEAHPLASADDSATAWLVLTDQRPEQPVRESESDESE